MRSSTARREAGEPAWFVGLGMSALLAVAFGLIWHWVGVRPSSAAPPEERDEISTLLVPFLQKHCVECHTGDKAEAGVSFSGPIDDAALRTRRKTWERVMQLVSQGVMPPADSPQPEPAETAKLLEFLHAKLHQIDCSQPPDPGRVTIRRLNRLEYNNTIRDLMEVSFRPADDFPSDDVGYGFDNIGDVLSLPPLLMEKYLDAAEKIAAEAVLEIDVDHPPTQEFERGDLHRGRAVEDHRDQAVVILSDSEVYVEHEFPVAGRYVFRVAAGQMPAGDEAAKMEFRIDGQACAVHEVTVKDPKSETYEFATKMERGTHKFAVAFLNDYYDPNFPNKNRRDRNLVVREIQIVGPTQIAPDDFPAFHRRLMTAVPGPDKSLADAARENLRPFMNRAFRRPVTDDEVGRMVRLVEQAAESGESFASAMRVAVTAVLVSPQFLFRIETDRDPNDPADHHPLNDFELATRLSYFLWSSLPDAELTQHAEQGDLHTDAVLDQQVRRMLADPKSQSLIESFCEQWLHLRILNEITPDPERFPTFDAALRNDLRRETLRFFEHIVRNDRSILECLDGKYSFVNARLAQHYGLAGIEGDELRQVDLSSQGRAGLITQGSILSLTSNPDRTSPVKRGKWIMEVILNQPPPPPPPNVPELAETAKAQPNLSLRQQLELHRQPATCGSCHRVMDQLGFGMENFDPIGRWRDTDGPQPLDVRGELPGGEVFNGPGELAGVLRHKQNEFTECLTEKLLTYALGRGLEYYDRCATVKISQALKERDFKFSVLVTEVVKSEPFRMRRGEALEQRATDSGR